MTGYGRYAPRRPGKTATAAVQLLLRAADDYREGKVSCVQVGANDGAMADPVRPFLVGHNWQGLLIEPHPAYFADLIALHGKNDRVTCVNVGISDSAGQMNLYHLNEQARDRYPRWIRGCASLDRGRMETQLQQAVQAFGAQGAPGDLVSVAIDLMPLEDILRAHEIEKADVLIIDVEGHEIPVLQSADLKALDLSLVIVECNGDVARSEPEIIRQLADCGLDVFRIGDEIVGLAPGRLKIPMEEMLAWLGVNPLSTTGMVH
ncbi:FkbM family methyltransferase [Frigidibacter sp. RF13]|uniref:FkbM family methyltransferase n=1 Tax=Frigidibacter sp. RF13 TaxID=2997340 RepID=UPI002270C5CB|nr:FkbM family methyltransferase [Frigidibacter sp. RF13]MCY1127090.1 FkbM family methyltransferase [Frigidibacter sp. RF13]